MKTGQRVILFVISIIFIIMSFGCTVGINSYTARAVNIKSNGTTYTGTNYMGQTITLSGVTVYLYFYNDSTGTYSTTDYYSTTVNSDGTINFDFVATGRYKMTGSSTNWTFIPRYVELSSATDTLPDLMAYPDDDDSHATIVASWADSSINVNLGLTYGKDSDLNDTTTFNWNNDTAAGTDERYRITESYPGVVDGILHNRAVDPTSTSGYPLAETITIYQDALSGWFAYDDTVKIYLTAPASAAVLTGDYVSSPAVDSAMAQIDLMIGAVHYGTWYAPYNTGEDVLEMIKLTFDNIDSVDGFWIDSSYTPFETESAVKSIIWE